MTCLAPGLIYGKPHPPEGALHPDEFGFIFDQVAALPHAHAHTNQKKQTLTHSLPSSPPQVSSLLVLNSTPFTHYPNPTFDPLGNAGILEVKPGSPIILKVKSHGLGGLSCIKVTENFIDTPPVLPG